jgi:uncharacterized membrane protein
MRGDNNIWSEKDIHLVFEVSLWLKGLFAISEAVAGIAAFFVSRQFLLGIVLWVTKAEFAEDPRDLVANFLFRSAQNLSVSTLKFTAVYLLAHGIIKLWLIIGLLRRRLWYYPTAIAVFALFIAYQLYRYTHMHSIWLLAITVLDIVVIGLTWHEYRYLRSVSRTA